MQAVLGTQLSLGTLQQSIEAGVSLTILVEDDRREWAALGKVLETDNLITCQATKRNFTLCILRYIHIATTRRLNVATPHAPQNHHTLRQSPEHRFLYTLAAAAEFTSGAKNFTYTFCLAERRQAISDASGSASS